jgi:hypothetical protein
VSQPEEGQATESGKTMIDNQTIEAAGKIIDSEPGKNLLNPITKEIGLTAGTVGNVFRFYIERNLERIFGKWAEQRHNRALQPEEFERVVPLLQAASLQTDEELQERWAALLESNVSDPDGVLPSFGRTLSEITAEEARYLERLHAHATRQFNHHREVGVIEQLLELYDRELFQMSYADHERLKGKLAKAHLLIEDLERLGLITAHSSAKDANKQVRIEGHQVFIPSGKDVKFTRRYSLSEYGVQFLRAVTPENRQTESEPEL